MTFQFSLREWDDFVSFLDFFIHSFTPVLFFVIFDHFWISFVVTWWHLWMIRCILAGFTHCHDQFMLKNGHFDCLNKSSLKILPQISEFEWCLRRNLTNFENFGWFSKNFFDFTEIWRHILSCITDFWRDWIDSWAGLIINLSKLINFSTKSILWYNSSMKTILWFNSPSFEYLYLIKMKALSVGLDTILPSISRKCHFFRNFKPEVKLIDQNSITLFIIS